MRIADRHKLFAPVVVALALAACGEEPPPRKTAAAPVESAAPAAPEPARKEAAAAATDVTDGVVVQRFRPRRDPFQSIVEARGRVAAEQTHPLQQFTIPQLRLIGIIWGIAEPVALVMTPAEEEYVVRPGTPIGTGDGKVVAILPDRVVIIERYYDYRGQLQTEKYEMILPVQGE